MIQFVGATAPFKLSDKPDAPDTEALHADWVAASDARDSETLDKCLIAGV